MNFAVDETIARGGAIWGPRHHEPSNASGPGGPPGWRPREDGTGSPCCRLCTG